MADAVFERYKDALEQGHVAVFNGRHKEALAAWVGGPEQLLMVAETSRRDGRDHAAIDGFVAAAMAGGVA